MSNNPFSDRYTKHSNAELLKILSRKTEYQLLAIEAAQEELDKRQLTEVQVREANAILAEKEQLKTLKEQANQAAKNKISSVFSKTFEIINPIQNSSPTAGKLIVLTCLVLSLAFIHEMTDAVSLLKFLLSSPDLNWDSSVVFALVPLILIPLEVFLLWRRKRVGWILCYIHFTFALFIAINTIGFLLLKAPLLLPPNRSLLTLPMVYYVEQITIPFGCMLVLSRKIVLDIYKINWKHISIIICGVGALIAFLDFKF